MPSPYNHAETYNGHDLVIDVYLNTGTVYQDDGKGNQVPVRTHTIQATDNGEVTTMPGITKQNLAQALTETLANMKALIDGISDPALIAILTDLGYAEIVGLSAPDNFVAVPGGLAGEIDLSWDNDLSADVYILSRSADPTFMDGTELEIYNGPYLLSLTDASLVTGDHYQYRIIAYKTGITASPASFANSVAA